MDIKDLSVTLSLMTVFSYNEHINGICYNNREYIFIGDKHVIVDKVCTPEFSRYLGAYDVPISTKDLLGQVKAVLYLHNLLEN